MKGEPVQNCTSIEKTNNMTLTVDNSPKTVSLKVIKNWANNENKTVTVQLMRDGTPVLGQDNTPVPVTLDGILDSVETVAWQAEFTELPLYVDGKLAAYTLRETKIGEFAYSAEYDDGYRYYSVTYSSMVYKDAKGDTVAVTGSPTEEQLDLITSGELTVTNTRGTNSLTVKKVDQDGAALAGAEFYLYSVSDMDTSTEPAYTLSQQEDGTYVMMEGETILEPVYTATSDGDGNVTFPTISTGSYYLIEHAAPAGYAGSQSIYGISVDDNVTKYQWDGTAWNVVTGTLNVTNEAQTVTVTINKIVTGNMGDRTKTFQFSVSCTEAMTGGTGYTLSPDGKTASFGLANGKSVTLQGMKKGSAITIVESDNTGYTVKVDDTVLEGSTYTYTVGADDTEVIIEVTNHKDGQPDTGVLLDSAPYGIVLTVAALLGVSLILRRKRLTDD